MKHNRKRLAMIALAIPAAVALSQSSNAWQTSGYSLHNGFSDAHGANGAYAYTSVEYDLSGVQITGIKTEAGKSTSTGTPWLYTYHNTVWMQSLETVTATWDENSYSNGYCYISGNAVQGNAGAYAY